MAALALVLYRTLECVDGEYGLHLIPYRLAQRWKVWLLRVM